MKRLRNILSVFAAVAVFAMHVTPVYAMESPVQENMLLNEVAVANLYDDFVSQRDTPSCAEEARQEILEFQDYAIDAGIVDDTPSARNEISKILIRSIFGTIADGGRRAGFTIAADFLEHSLDDNPTDLVFQSGSDVADAIMGSSDFETVRSRCRSSSSATVYGFSGSVALNHPTDLKLAFHWVDYTGIGNRSSGRLVMSCTITDTYDFDAVSWNDANMGNALVDLVNNYAALAQEFGAIVPYDISVYITGVNVS